MPQNTIYYSTEANAKHWAQCAPREWACTVAPFQGLLCAVVKSMSGQGAVGLGDGGSVGGAWPVCVGKLNSVDCLVVNLNKAHLHTNTHARTHKDDCYCSCFVYYAYALCAVHWSWSWSATSLADFLGPPITPILGSAVRDFKAEL